MGNRRLRIYRNNETVRTILEKHAANCEVTVIGEFEEPEWAVLPGRLGTDA